MEGAWTTMIRALAHIATSKAANSASGSRSTTGRRLLAVAPAGNDLALADMIGRPDQAFLFHALDQ
ncbi:UNVERIFIED_ORG: hypothetical protein M2312_001806 [Rhizobium esperanzae]|nr:hypothetical protein [Rhizobium esperanzae]